MGIKEDRRKRMMVQVLEADECRVRLSSLQTGRRNREPQTPERKSLLVFRVESCD